MKRRELFGSLVSSFGGEKQENLIIRPPYYKDETDFHKNCIDCIDKPCISVCEEQIIKLLDDGTPHIDFAITGCTYCDDCAEACEKDVLKVENLSNINVSINIDILKCFSWNQTMCFSCKDPCIDDAIEFLGMFRPEIIQDKCTSCGFCVKVCPAGAITISENKQKEENI
jgi:ferredoxin-type protein NapF